MTSEETDEQHRLLSEKGTECLIAIDKLRPNHTGHARCPMIWDGAYCWPSAAPGELLVVPCPDYVHGFNRDANASKLCTANSTWWRHWDTGDPWTNYSLCAYPRWGVPVGINSSLLTPHLPTIKLISKVGYTVSLITLVLAFCILASVRRLRCPRNNLHLHLFMSFIMRSLMLILKDSLYEAGMDVQGPTTSFDGIQVVLDWESSVECRVFTSFWHYFLMANYSWILMEGLYLHNLIFLAMFTDNSGIIRYVLAGWGVPALLLLPWIVVRITLENTLCWTTNDNPGFFWIIRGPITVSIMANFAFFLNITRVLFLKLFSVQAPQARQYRYRKWFRSTLVLVPLFGVHYALLLAMNLVAGVHEGVELVWLYIDQLFSSFQGSVVALLYCFFNGEVQSEIRKGCSPFITFRRPQLHGFGQENHSTSVGTQSISLLSRTGRCSIHSLNLPADGTFNATNKCQANKADGLPCRGSEDSRI